MGIKDLYKVKSIKKELCKEWFLKKHYARRLPNICYSFGLYKLNNLVGVLSYGVGGNPNINKINDYKMIELNRLVTNENLDKNSLSYFVSQTIKMMPPNIIIISYADENKNHHGYIYQATNFIYTGLSSKENIFIIDNKEIHRKTFYERHGTSSEKKLLEIYKDELKIIKGKPKHRYLYLKLNKKDKKKIKKVWQYKEYDYPKGKNIRYDANYNPLIQTELFL